MFKKDDRVIYVPRHANGDTSHPDCESGKVSSVNDSGTVFVRFDAGVQSCDASTLVHEQNHSPAEIAAFMREGCA